MTALATAVAEVTRRAGGATYQHGGDALTAIVTARAAGEFDVVLELSATAATLRVWGLERRYEFSPNDEDAAAAAVLGALDEWLALLSGETRLAIYYQGGSACCWSFTGPASERPAERHWHPRPPAPRATRWVRRWRKQVLANPFLDAAGVREARAELESAVAPVPELAAVA